MEWFGSLRTRVGMPVTDRFLAYLTGGAVYGETRSSISVSSGGKSLGDIGARRGTWGWTVGAGGEYAMTDTMSIKTEYLYTDLGKANLIAENLGGTTVSMLADGEATTRQLMDVLGHDDIEHAELYSRSDEQNRLAHPAMQKIVKLVRR